MSERPKFPHVPVSLSGEDGNAVVVITRIVRALRDAGVSQSDIEAFRNDAVSGDYDHLLDVARATVSVT